MKVEKFQEFMNEKFGNVRTVLINDVVYFIGNDIAKALSYTNTAKAISVHCKKAIKTTIDVSSQSGKSDTKARKTQEMYVIPKSDIYRLIVRSKLPSAEEFESWIFDEIIPQIELTGGYIPIEESDTDELIMAKALKIADKTIQEKDTLISILEPQAKAYKDLMTANGYLQFLDVAAMVEIGRTKLFEFLRSKKVLTKQSNFNIPYGRFATNGMFKVITELNKGRITSVTMISPTGLNYIYKLIKKNDMLDEFNTLPLLEVVNA